MSGLGIESICTANGESQHLRSSVLGSLAMPALRFSAPNYLTLVRQLERVGYFHCWSFSLLHLFLFPVCSRHNRGFFSQWLDSNLWTDTSWRYIYFSFIYGHHFREVEHVALSWLLLWLGRGYQNGFAQRGLARRLHGTDKICSGLSCTLLAGCELWDGLTNG